MPSNLPTDPPGSLTPLRRFLSRVLVELRASRVSPIPAGFFRRFAWPFAAGRLRHFFVRTVFVLACLATLVATFFIVEKVRGRAAWRAYEAEAKARGVKLTVAEYVPPPVPDAENFAAIPVFQDAFRVDAARHRVPNPFVLPQWKKGGRPPLDNPPKQQRTDLAAWQKLFVEAKVIPEASQNAAADVLTALSNYDAALDQLGAAAARPRCRFPVRYEDGIAANFPHIRLIMDAGRLYALRMAAHLARGQAAEAWEDFRGGLRLCQALEDEPTFIAGIVRVSVLSMQAYAVWGGITANRWSEVQLRAIESSLRPLQLLGDYQLSMNRERAFENQAFDTLRGQSGSGLARMIVGMSSQPQPSGAFALGFYPRGWIYLSQERTNRYFDERLARITADPPRLDLSRPGVFSNNPRSTYDRISRMFFYLMVPVLDDQARGFARTQALTDQTRIACALERHRLERGEYPARLDSLAPEFIPTVPRDVMTGEPLRFQLFDGGKRFTLYSVGFNQKDDGGEIGDKTSANDHLDWVWHSAAK